MISDKTCSCLSQKYDSGNDGVAASDYSPLIKQSARKVLVLYTGGKSFNDERFISQLTVLSYLHRFAEQEIPETRNASRVDRSSVFAQAPWAWCVRRTARTRRRPRSCVRCFSTARNSLCGCFPTSCSNVCPCHFLRCAHSYR